MSSIKRAVAACLIALAALGLFTPERAEAGRIGGPASEAGVIGPGQEAWFDVPLQEGTWTRVTARGDGRSTISLTVFDGDGNSVVGAGVLGTRVANVYAARGGYFRILIRNAGSTLATRVTVSAN